MVGFSKDKRVGYLALIIMLQEKDEVLMLSTNSLKARKRIGYSWNYLYLLLNIHILMLLLSFHFKVDLNGHNRFQVGLALTALGNLGTADMCRDLVMEVDKHLKVSDVEECGCKEESTKNFILFLF